MPKIIPIPKFLDSRGDLHVVEKFIPFNIKRVYWISNVIGQRGGHRHKKNVQGLICIKGSCIVKVNNGSRTTEWFLDCPEKLLLLECEDWHVMHSFSSDAILLVLASQYYDKDDYIDEEYKTN